jgi:hypothetical protein
MLLKALRLWLSRQMRIAWIAAAGRLTPLSPMPRHARHGNMVTGAHQEEVVVSADGTAGAPPSWATANAPPASAYSQILICIYLLALKKQYIESDH